MTFHDVRFPTAISRGATGGPERRTDIVVLGSGREERNTRWADSRRRYNAGYGVKALDDLHDVIAFFEARRGRLYGFRWRDPMDWKSCPPEQVPSPTDCEIGLGDAATDTFQLIKTYADASGAWPRPITKPVAGSVRVAVNGAELTAGTDFNCDPARGVVTFSAGAVPDVGAIVTAGFLFDVPVRFDADTLEINLSGFQSGAIPAIPIVEVRP
ncbi:MAG: DUF2460 domain-containing protein [Pseudomonadota bacterium]